jgi:hypothetical protein
MRDKRGRIFPSHLRSLIDGLVQYGQRFSVLSYSLKTVPCASKELHSIFKYRRAGLCPIGYVFTRMCARRTQNVLVISILC